MDTKSDEQLLVIETTIGANNQETDKNQMRNDEKLTLLTENIQVLTALMTDNINSSESSPSQKSYSLS